MKWVFCESRQVPLHHNCVYVNEVTFGTHKGWELVARGTDTVIIGLDLSVPQMGGERDWLPSALINGVVNHAYVTKSPKRPEWGTESSRGGGQQGFGEWWTMGIWGVVCSGRGCCEPFSHTLPSASLPPG